MSILIRLNLLIVWTYTTASCCTMWARGFGTSVVKLSWSSGGHINKCAGEFFKIRKKEILWNYEGL